MAAENGSLIISRVTEDHEAAYLCLANNGVGPGLNKLIRLTVNGKCTFLFYPFPFILWLHLLHVFTLSAFTVDVDC